jgi:uncharacterized protein
LKIRQKAENLFGWIGRTSAQKPWLYIAAAILLLAVSLWQLQFLVIDTTTEGFLKKDDPAILVFNAFKDEFGRDEQFIVSLEADDVFKPGFVKEFIRLHETLNEKVPHVDEVNSLYNARDIYGDEGELIVQDFFEEMPVGDAEWAAKAKKAYAHPLYKNTYLSADGKMVNIYIRPTVNYADKNEKTGEIEYKMLAEPQIHEMVVAIRAVVKEFPAINQRVHIAGTPVLTEELSEYLVRDMALFVVLAIGVIAIILFVIFRRIVSVIMPLIVVITALVSTMSMMSLTSQPVQMPTVILPSFILAVGVGDSIHLLSMFFNYLQQGLTKEKALEEALVHSGLPIFFTSITTAAGLASFGGGDILPVSNLGLFGAAGVMFAFVYTIILLPALIMLFPVKPPVPKEHKKRTLIDRFIEFSIHFSQTWPKSIVVGGLIFTGLCFYGASLLRFSHDPIKWLPESSQGRQAIEYVGAKVGGTVPVEIIIDTGKFDGVKDVEFMRQLDESVLFLESYQSERVAAGKVLAVTTLLKETNKALYDNAESYYVIPDSRELIAQEFLMLETSGAEDLFKLVDSNYQKARVTVLTPWVDALYFGDYVRGMEHNLKQRFGDNATIEITGIVPMLAKTLKEIMHATAWSYLIAFLVITIMMMALLGSVKYGLVSMLPNILPITFVMALMKVIGAPLDMFTMLIGAIAIGLAVDDTVHFMHGFMRYYAKTGDANLAVQETLHSSGRAMVITSIVLMLGFVIYVFSAMNNLINFGIYTSLCIVVALLADFWLAPALVILMNHKKNNG